MGRGEDDRSHFLGEPVARISVDDSGRRGLTAKPPFAV